MSERCGGSRLITEWGPIKGEEHRSEPKDDRPCPGCPDCSPPAAPEREGLRAELEQARLELAAMTKARDLCKKQADSAGERLLGLREAAQAVLKNAAPPSPHRISRVDQDYLDLLHARLSNPALPRSAAPPSYSDLAVRLADAEREAERLRGALREAKKYLDRPRSASNNDEAKRILAEALASPPEAGERCPTCESNAKSVMRPPGAFCADPWHQAEPEEPRAEGEVPRELPKMGDDEAAAKALSFLLPPGYLLMRREAVEELHNESEALRIERDAAREMQTEDGVEPEGEER